MDWFGKRDALEHDADARELAAARVLSGGHALQRPDCHLGKAALQMALPAMQRDWAFVKRHELQEHRRLPPQQSRLVEDLARTLLLRLGKWLRHA
ncbi:hypothetical protein [Mumia zhuanghuii]|uniref:Uncharacterized protein n=1 Tax=Mumia zhuanghuii TaxID=2585211 RepID=A0A5C4MEB0_9ACTN|nr:hypothetical protein [Mumia zhuanghuii]TNC36448.1 hypothetical protein FHE65_26215 [Mumia zhuanghuii]